MEAARCRCAHGRRRRPGPSRCRTGTHTRGHASLLLNLELVATVILAAIDFHEHLGRQKGGAPGSQLGSSVANRVMLEQSYVGQPGPRLALGRRRHHHIGRRLSFATREHEGGGYGYATRDGIETHLGVVSDDQPSSAKHSAYLWVDGADALALAWRAAGAAVHLPEDTDWQQHQGAHVDPDGNVLRFGSPVVAPTPTTCSGTPSDRYPASRSAYRPP